MRVDSEAFMAEALALEAALPDDECRATVLQRLQSWLSLTPEEGQQIAAIYRAAFGRLTPEERDIVAAAERDVALRALRYGEYERLCRFATWLDEGQDLPVILPRKGDFWSNLAFALAVTGDV